MKRIARREDTGDVHELATFTGNTGSRDVPGAADERARSRRLAPRRPPGEAAFAAAGPDLGEGAASALSERAALLAHAQTICGVPISREITPELRRALALKPRPEEFI
jgi:hypothetical protein